MTIVLYLMATVSIPLKAGARLHLRPTMLTLQPAFYFMRPTISLLKSLHVKYPFFLSDQTRWLILIIYILGVKYQPWILETQESPHTAKFRMDAKEMRNFDYLASYHLQSAFLFSYYSPAVMDVATRPLPMDFLTHLKKKHKAPIVWIARNCGATSGRHHYIEQLMQYIDVDSYGSCLNNVKYPEGKDRMELMGEYKFYLAIENANCDDYVTEKLFDTLLVSTVPIVDGPNSYQGFLPDKNAAIRMDAFPDPRELAKYIDYLDKNDTAYLEHMAFRRDALDIPARERLDPTFIGNWSDPSFHNMRSSWCSVCRGMLPWWQARQQQQQQNIETIALQQLQQQHKKDTLLVDKSCMEGGKWDYAQEGPPYLPDWEKSPHPLTLLLNDGGEKHPATSQREEFMGRVHSDAYTARKVWAVELVLGTFFMAFVAFVVIRGRRRHRSKQFKSEIPLSVN
ncbi:hypothetical protein BDB00DRAFT_846622 [Zychaea mexicana]|uniref:uncharacterized protein n=1 Tax=Zychaea mexicana TaxID=64656 RepID=UPI0022FDF265|nr:uncharacterized protein BDB00DRAFT_846622 [Zychaea mexicana]KAI9488799.1 hypothetical protein BDB00DRAFT_846622 [Zychaea mexicana]